MIAFIFTEVDDAGEAVLGADRQLDRSTALAFGGRFIWSKTA